MSNLWQKISTRLPGGDLWTWLMAYPKLRGTDFEQLAQVYKTAYFRGGTSFNFTDQILKAFESKHCQGDIYDFGSIKLYGKDIAEMHSAFVELILPYLLPTPIEIGEGLYETEVVNVEKDDIVLDAGANLGFFTTFAAMRGAKVYAFEPVSSIASRLQQTIELNHCSDQVTVCRTALSNKQGFFDIHICDNNLGASTLLSERAGEANFTHTETIRLTTIDRFVEEFNLPSVDFIKADIEGAERDMLAGAKETLRQFKPKLAICTYHLPDDPEVLTRLIKDANPDYQIKHKKHKLIAW